MTTEIQPFSYTSTTPAGYVCAKCGASGVRLYRDYNTFADFITLTCTACTEESENRKAKGKAHSIGWKVAAVPTEDGSTFWGYTSVPQAGVEWWDRLPVSR